MKMKKFNGVDILIITFILIVGVFVFLYLNPSDTGSKLKNIYFTVEIRNVADNVAKNYEIGSNVRDGVTDVYYGKISEVIIKPTEFVNENQEAGEFVLSTVDGQNSAFITVVGQGFDSPEKLTISGVNLNVGKLAYVKGKGFAGEGFITGLVVE